MGLQKDTESAKGEGRGKHEGMEQVKRKEEAELVPISAGNGEVGGARQGRRR